MRNHRYPLNRTKVILFVLALGLASVPSLASSWVGLYGGKLHDHPTAMAPTSDGGFLLAAYTESFGHGSDDRPDVLLLKLDDLGMIQWQEVIGTPGHTDKAFSIIEASDGRFILVGITYNAKTGFAEAWVVALKPHGKIAWQRAYDGQHACYAQSIAECPDGGFILCGTWWDPEFGMKHPWSLRLDHEGNVLWQRSLANRERGYSYVQGEWKSVLPAEDGGSFVSGWYEDDRVSPPVKGMQFAKLDPDGNIQWQRLYEGTYGGSLLRTSDGGFALLRNRYSITRLDPLGNVVWNMDYANATSAAYFMGMVPNFARGFVVLSGTEPPVLFGVSDEGVEEWRNAYQGARQALYNPHTICGALDGGVAVASFSSIMGLLISVFKTDTAFSLADPCSVTTAYPTFSRPHTNVVELGPPDLDLIDLEPAYAKTHIVPGITAVNEAHSFCPVIFKIRKLHNPFRLDISGEGFYNWLNPDNPSWWVTINGVRVPEIKPVSDHRFILKGAKELKAMLPKGTPVCIRISSPEPLYDSGCYTYTRGGEGECESDKE